MSDGQIKTTYLDHVIVYAENEDIWRCWDFDVEGKTLSAVKEKMRKLDAEARKIPDLEAFELDNWNRVTPVVINLLDAERDSAWVLKREKNWRHGGDGKEVTSRRKVSLERLYLQTPETDAILDELKAAVAAEQKAHKLVEAVRKKLKPVTREALVGVENAERREPEWKRRRRR